MALPPLTLEALVACAASPAPCSFYLPANPDLVEGADLLLCVERRELPVHSRGCRVAGGGLCAAAEAAAGAAG